MNTKQEKTLTDREVMLKILDKLSSIEKLMSLNTQLTGQAAITAAAGVQGQSSGELKERLKRLTIKRHAVLTASLGDVSYQKIAELMKCDDTTVKLHLKSALNILDIESRSILLTNHKHMLDAISDKEYERLFGISKRWWLELKPDLMAVIATTKTTGNQYSNAAAKKRKS